MEFIDIIFFISSYIIISVLISFTFIFVFKVKLIISNWFIYLIAFVGVVIGGIVDLFLGNFLSKLADLGGRINIYPLIFFSFITLYLFSKALKK